MHLEGQRLYGHHHEVSKLLQEAEVMFGTLEHQLMAYKGFITIPDVNSNLDAVYDALWSREFSKLLVVLQARLRHVQNLPQQPEQIAPPQKNVIVNEELIIPPELLYSVGDEIRLPCPVFRYVVLAGPYTGGKGVVYKVESIAGVACIKFAKEHRKARIELSGEVERDAELRERSFPSARIHWSDETTVLKEWVEGRSAWDWYQVWMKDQKNDLYLAALYALIQRSIDQGIYIDGLNPDNLIFDEAQNQWVIVDAKPFYRDLSRDAVLNHYIKYIEYRWGGPIHERIMRWFE